MSLHASPAASAAVLGAGAEPPGTPLPALLRPVPRALRHPRLMHYNRLVVLLLAANAVAAIALVRSGGWPTGPAGLRALSLAAQVNLVLATLPRQHWMVNLVCRLATWPSLRWPLRARWTMGKYYHLGGMHVGAAVSGTAWYAAFVAALVAARWRGTAPVATTNLVVSGLVVALFVGMCLSATPRQRAVHHDRFEATHRFGGWLAIALVWVNTVCFVGAQAGGHPLPVALAGSASVWLLVVSTLFAAWPWLLLRKVPVTVERPSDHAAIVHLHHRTRPPIGTTRAISRHPLFGWHHFACVPARAGEDGYRMLVSRAGDWTGAFIDDPPAHVWVRGIPTVGVANTKRLFTRVVYVATGSGIGPALGHLLTDTQGSRLVWVTRDPHRTYGALAGEVLTAQPDALVWSSDELGKPDVLRLAYHAYEQSGAEAVICIANKTATWRVVAGLEQRGIPAFGPIWDS